MLHITLSRVFTGIDRVPHACYTAEQVKPELPGGVVRLSTLPPARVEHLPAELAGPLQNQIAAGNTEAALDLLRHSYQSAIEGRALALHTLRGYYVNLLNIVTTAVVLEGFDPPDWLAQLFLHSQADEMQATVEQAATTLCERVRSSRKSHASQLADQIMDFLQQEYTNSELTLSYVADHFHITSSYLSTFFKENVGDTFLNTLTRLRVERAKELIRTTHLPMVEIAAQVGYTSGNTFTRIFKKVEGITPSQYRESL